MLVGDGALIETIIGINDKRLFRTPNIVFPPLLRFSAQGAGYWRSRYQDLIKFL